jgi:hypothetical protein
MKRSGLGVKGGSDRWGGRRSRGGVWGRSGRPVSDSGGEVEGAGGGEELIDPLLCP